MALIPNTKSGKVAFFQSKVEPWTDNATLIGTSAPEVAAMATKVTAAADAIAAQIAAKAAAETATAAADNAVAALMTAGSDIIKQIRTKAAISGDSVYELAQIPAPAIPGPVGAPGKPFEFVVNLEENGSLTLKWKCPNPVGCTGVMYQVWRKVGTGDFEYVGGCGSKQFVDNTIPAGSSNITYQMQATRSTAVGPWAQFNVNFGVNGGTTVTESQPSKLAA